MINHLNENGFFFKKNPSNLRESELMIDSLFHVAPPPGVVIHPVESLGASVEHEGSRLLRRDAQG